eukprot:TRINITY_DN29636_c0_g1_i1.p2 TRINITY_DN29636_c0_g1~~TRINITY_DN29636_c0_g1_i1.p2  ORF type:complete len:126 (-),score=4.42 TRINITY_DN29636_c0_g1_i1:1-378(-)
MCIRDRTCCVHQRHPSHEWRALKTMSTSLAFHYVQSNKAIEMRAMIPIKSATMTINAIQTLPTPVSYTHLRAHETSLHLVCRLLLEKKKKTNSQQIAPHTATYRMINHKTIYQPRLTTTETHHRQ